MSTNKDLTATTNYTREEVDQIVCQIIDQVVGLKSSILLSAKISWSTRKLSSG